MTDLRRFTAKRYIKSLWDEDGDGPSDPVEIQITRSNAQALVDAAEFVSKASPNTSVLHGFTLMEVQWPVKALQEFSDHPIANTDFQFSYARVESTQVVFEVQHHRFGHIPAEPVALEEIADFFDIPVPWLQEIRVTERKQEACNLLTNMVMSQASDDREKLSEFLALFRSMFAMASPSQVVDLLDALRSRIQSSAFYEHMHVSDAMNEIPSAHADREISELIDALKSAAA